MITKEHLETETKKFFDLHWGSSPQIPTWDFSWNWCNAVPNHELGGVYALFSGDALIYIGLGASIGGGIYKNRGISRRLLAHVLQITPAGSSASYEPQKHWKEASVDSIATIGFPPELTYLACALEDYLIGKLNPPKNNVKRRSAVHCEH